MISGTPQAAGVFSVTLSATNANGVGTLVLALNVGTTLAPTVTTRGVRLARSGKAVSFAIEATNSPTSFAASSLPDGLTVEPASGTISGVPTTSGIYRVTLTATNSDGAGSSTLLLLVDRVQPWITGFSRPSAVRGERVRIMGEGFSDAMDVYFTNWIGQLVRAPLTIESDTAIEVVIPDVRRMARMITRAGSCSLRPPARRSRCLRISRKCNRPSLPAD